MESSKYSEMGCGGVLTMSLWEPSSILSADFLQG